MTEENAADIVIQSLKGVPSSVSLPCILVILRYFFLKGRRIVATLGDEILIVCLSEPQMCKKYEAEWRWEIDMEQVYVYTATMVKCHKALCRYNQKKSLVARQEL